MATFSVHVIGARQVSRNLLKLGRDAPKVVGGALFREANRIMTEIKTVPFVPIDTGALMGSGLVPPPEIDSRGATVIMGFGGPAAPYALIQHENLAYHHPVGQAKYLSEPVNRELPAIRKAVSTAVNAAVRRLPKK